MPRCTASMVSQCCSRIAWRTSAWLASVHPHIAFIVGGLE
jgi:hypothetical protein